MPKGQYDRTKRSAMPDPDLTSQPAEMAPPDDDGLPSRDELMARLAELEVRLASVPAADDGDMPNLIVPTRLAPTIDLNKPEDCPDQPDGEWSKRHLAQFLARQPRTMIFIPKESWEPKGEDSFQTIGFQGHWFRVRKGYPESVPIQIAAIIEQSQQDFPTMQSMAKKRQLVDIRDLPESAGSRGVAGVEVVLNR